MKRDLRESHSIASLLTLKVEDCRMKLVEFRSAFHRSCDRNESAALFIRLKFQPQTKLRPNYNPPFALV